MSDNTSPEADGEEEWATVGAPIKPRRLAPQTNLVKPDFIATPSAVSTNDKDNNEDEASKKAIIRFTREELVQLRPPSSSLLACMEDIADIISVDAIEPEVSSPPLLSTFPIPHYTTNTLLVMVMAMVLVIVMVMIIVVVLVLVVVVVVGSIVTLSRTFLCTNLPFFLYFPAKSPLLHSFLLNHRTKLIMVCLYSFCSMLCHAMLC